MQFLAYDTRRGDIAAWITIQMALSHRLVQRIVQHRVTVTHGSACKPFLVV